ncbi:hypothetical protein Tco_1328120 [Tanacetum coccineum]
MFQDLETNLYWEFGKFTSRDGESLESYYLRFYKMMNELVKNQCYQSPSECSVLTSITTRMEKAATRNKGKAIVNSSSPTYDQEPEMVAEDDALSKEKEIDKLIALISLSCKKIYKPTNNNLRTSSNTSRAHQDNTLRINRGTGYDNQRVVNIAGARENVEQADWRDDTDDEPEDQELEAHYLYMAQIQEVTIDAVDNSGPIFDAKPLQKVQNNNDNYNVFANDREHPEQTESVNDTYMEEQGDNNITIDSLDMSTNGETVDQDDDDLAKECDSLASLIEKLKCEIDDIKNRNKFLESLNKTLVDKLKDLKKFQAELDRYHDVNYASKVEIDCAKAKGDLMEYYYADHMNAILGVYTTLDEFTYLQCDYVDQVVKCERLEKELSKSNTTSKSFEALQQHDIDLELALQQCQE